MKALRNGWNKFKAANMEANGLNYLEKKKWDKFFRLIPKWEDYEFLRLEEHPALLKILLMEDSEQEDKDILLDRFSKLKYRAKAVNNDDNLFHLSPYHLIILNDQLELAEKLNSWGGNPHQLLRNGNTILHAAVAQNCSLDVLEYIS